jgi:ParB/RepB/Spo0J family partition protein
MQQNFDHILFDPDFEVSLIYADPMFNCRGDIDQNRLIELADSIKKYGLQCPIMVQPWRNAPEPARYRIISGHRRFFACTQFLKWEAMPVLVNTEPLDNTEARFLNLVENLNRHDLTQLETAFNLKNLIDDGFTVHELATKLNKTVHWINAQLLILELDPKIQPLVISKKLSFENMEYLSSFPIEVQEHALKKLLDYNHRTKTKLQNKTVQARPKIAEIKEMLEWAVDYNHQYSANALAWVLGLVETDDYKRKAQYEPQKHVPRSGDAGEA